MKSDYVVYVVDDDDAVRDSLVWSLEGAGYAVLPFPSADCFLGRYDAFRPGCLLLDVRMPGMSGLEVQEKLNSRQTEGEFPLPLIFITGHGDVQMAVQTMKQGAVDFIEKPFQDTTLFSLIDRAMGNAFVVWEASSKKARDNRLLSRLTPREREVLSYVVAGKLNKQIADQLDISIKTVEAHRAHAMSKLGARTMAEVIKIFLGHSVDRG